MTKKSGEIRTHRRQYRKPQLEQVKLVLEEAVLQTCKTRTSFGPTSTTCSVGNCNKTTQKS
jgi:hypothetical protein